MERRDRIGNESNGYVTATKEREETRKGERRGENKNVKNFAEERREM